MLTGSRKKAYNTLKTLTKTSKLKASGIADTDGNPLTDSAAVLNKWTEYFIDMYNYPLQPDSSFLKNDPHTFIKVWACSGFLKFFSSDEMGT